VAVSNARDECAPYRHPTPKSNPARRKGRMQACPQVPEQDVTPPLSKPSYILSDEKNAWLAAAITNTGGIADGGTMGVCVR